jgi:glycosyltransferase involved in cell wall biosynthesis
MKSGGRAAFGQPSRITVQVAQAGKTVALFSAYYPAHGGGMELASADLAHALLAVGIEVEWVSQLDSGLPQDLEDICTPVAGTDVIYALSGVPMPLPMPWALPTICRAAKRAGVVVVVEANFMLSIIAFMMAKLLHKPVLLIQHVGKPSTVSKLARLVMSLGEKIATRPMVRNADAVVYVSSVVSRYFDGEGTGAKRFVIGHGIDMQRFRPRLNEEERTTDRKSLGLGPSGKIACYVGRLTESKGISVVAEIARLRPDWTFAVAGAGPVEPARWGLPNVVVMGQLDRTEVSALYRACDAMILPSQSESFSIVVREALASGCSVFCSNQILDTDAGLEPFVITERVDLSDVSGTGARFAAALDRRTSASRNIARDYVATHCSQAVVREKYVILIRGMMAGKGGAIT